MFLRAPASSNHHDLACFTIGQSAGPSAAGRTTVGLYHLAWEVRTIDALVVAAEELEAAGALAGASDHGVSKSLYGADPDGNEFELMWRVPSEAWGEDEHRGAIRPLDLKKPVFVINARAEYNDLAHDVQVDAS